MIVCKDCGQEKGVAEFYTSVDRGKVRRAACCKRCQTQRTLRSRKKNRGKHNARVAAFRKANPEKALSADLRRFGITSADYFRMLEFQGGVCAICSRPEPQNTKCRRLFVDHNHETGKVRALLCQACNSAIGYLKEDPALCIASAEYLKKYNGCTRPK